MRAKRSLPWEKGGTGVSFPLAKANSVVLRGGIGLTWRKPQLKRLSDNRRAEAINLTEFFLPQYLTHSSYFL